MGHFRLIKMKLPAFFVIASSVTAEPGVGDTISCNGNQMHGVPSANCNKWVQCTWGTGIVQRCAPGTFWNKNRNSCGWACANPDNCCLYPEPETTEPPTTTTTTTTTTTEELTSVAQTTAAPMTAAPTTIDTTTTTAENITTDGPTTSDGTDDDSTTDSATIE